MKKTLIKTVNIVLCLTMLVGFAINSSAVDEDLEEYLIFTNSNSRMESDGDFTFRTRASVTSDTFEAIGTVLSIDIIGQIYDQGQESVGENPYYADRSVEYSVVLYKKILFGGIKVDEYLICADNHERHLSFDVDKGAKYYFTIIVKSDLSGTGKYVEGSGTVNSVTLS